MHIHKDKRTDAHISVQLPVISNEHDDYRLFHTRGDPRDFNIASLKGGQDMYGKAVDVEGPAFTKQESNLATMGQLCV